MVVASVIEGTEFAILSDVIAATVVIYLMRVGYFYVIRRQRLDWTRERKQTKESIIKAHQIVGRLTRWYWKGSTIFSTKNKT
jgi:hypothetical protein